MKKTILPILSLLLAGSAWAQSSQEYMKCIHSILPDEGTSLADRLEVAAVCQGVQEAGCIRTFTRSAQSSYAEKIEAARLCRGTPADIRGATILSDTVNLGCVNYIARELSLADKFDAATHCREKTYGLAGGASYTESRETTCMEYVAPRGVYSVTDRELAARACATTALFRR